MEDKANAFFKDDFIVQTKCIELSSIPEEAMAWEFIQVSEYSPGIVKDDETVARLLFSPHHIDKVTNDIQPVAFSDVFDKGLSVNRLKYISIGDMCKFGDEMAKTMGKSNSEREFIAYMTGSVSEIRKQLAEGFRVFAVYDTSNESAIMHADVCSILSIDIDVNPKLTRKGIKKLVRARLSNIFSNLIVIEK